MALLGETMKEPKSRLTLLVIEDNAEFARNAMEAFEGHSVMHASALDEALSMMRSRKVDYIVSDVHFPTSKGKEPKENISFVLKDAMERAIPVALITKADHHGLTEQGDEGMVAICPLSIDDLALSLMRISAEGVGKSAFSLLKCESRKTVKSDSKTPELWKLALEMLRNACTQARPISKAVEKMRGLGFMVTVEYGMARVLPPTKK